VTPSRSPSLSSVASRPGSVRGPDAPPPFSSVTSRPDAPGSVRGPAVPAPLSSAASGRDAGVGSAALPLGAGRARALFDE
jgi:hypothetical protein